jgi:hypothetical protein
MCRLLMYVQSLYTVMSVVVGLQYIHIYVFRDVMGS